MECLKSLTTRICGGGKFEPYSTPRKQEEARVRDSYDAVRDSDANYIPNGYSALINYHNYGDGPKSIRTGIPDRGPASSVLVSSSIITTDHHEALLNNYRGSAPQGDGTVHVNHDLCAQVENTISIQALLLKKSPARKLMSQYQTPKSAVVGKPGSKEGTNKLGEGGFGSVVKLQHRQTGALRAVKSITIDPTMADLISNELSILVDLDHINVLKFYEWFQEESTVYIVTEICEGGELTELLYANEGAKKNKAPLRYELGYDNQRKSTGGIGETPLIQKKNVKAINKQATMPTQAFPTHDLSVITEDMNLTGAIPTSSPDATPLVGAAKSPTNSPLSTAAPNVIITPSSPPKPKNGGLGSSEGRFGGAGMDDGSEAKLNRTGSSPLKKQMTVGSLDTTAGGNSSKPTDRKTMPASVIQTGTKVAALGLSPSLERHSSDKYPGDWRPRVKDVTIQILSAVAYCHSMGVVHRDLKLENCLLQDKSPDTTIKIIDFGLAGIQSTREISEDKNQFNNLISGDPRFATGSDSKEKLASEFDIKAKQHASAPNYSTERTGGAKITSKDKKNERSRPVPRNSKQKGSKSASEAGSKDRPAENNKFKEVLGTPFYIAPEIVSKTVIKKGYNEAVDLWACGVIMYVLLTGDHPFLTRALANKHPKKLFHRIKTEPPHMIPLEKVSSQAKDLILKLLDKNPDTRITAANALKHPWCKSAHNNKQVENFGCLANITQFVQREKFERVMLTIIAHEAHGSEIEKLQRAFVAVDEDKTGLLTRDEVGLVFRQHLEKEISDQELELLFETLDADGSGQISYTEWLSATISQKLMTKQQHIDAAFQYFDLDGSGVIVRDELISVLGEAADADEVLREMGKNPPDGTITREEFGEFCKFVGNRSTTHEKLKTKNTMNKLGTHVLESVSSLGGDTSGTERASLPGSGAYPNSTFQVGSLGSVMTITETPGSTSGSGIEISDMGSGARIASPSNTTTSNSGITSAGPPTFARAPTPTNPKNGSPKSRALPRSNSGFTRTSAGETIPNRQSLGSQSSLAPRASATETEFDEEYSETRISLNETIGGGTAPGGANIKSFTAAANKSAMNSSQGRKLAALDRSVVPFASGASPTNGITSTSDVGSPVTSPAIRPKKKSITDGIKQKLAEVRDSDQSPASTATGSGMNTSTNIMSTSATSRGNTFSTNRSSGNTSITSRTSPRQRVMSKTGSTSFSARSAK